MKTTRQQQDATRRQIVASAVDLMTRQGFDGTTMKDIARAAGIGDATIYKYFPTKDRIVLELKGKPLGDGLVSGGASGPGSEPPKVHRISATGEAVAALMGLGIAEPVGRRAVEHAVGHLGEEADVGALVKAALKEIGR